MDEEKREVTTWMGDKLGGYSLNGSPWRDNFGSERVPIYVYGTNGVRYHGTYYRSAGDYARITAYKVQPEPTQPEGDDWQQMAPGRGKEGA